jgi:hypothetical protein
LDDIPDPDAAIVLKLLANTAEDRCQTAAWVEADLSPCLDEFLAHGRVVPFPLGVHDTRARSLIPEILYGRESRIDALGAAFDQVVTFGTTEVVLVSGYAGIGKSSLVNEPRRILVRSRPGPRPPPAQGRSRCGLAANASPRRICPNRYSATSYERTKARCCGTPPPAPVPRGPVYKAEPLPFDHVPAFDQADQAYRRPVSGEKSGTARVHAGADRGA